MRLSGATRGNRYGSDDTSILAGLLLAIAGLGLYRLRPRALDMPRATRKPRLPDIRDREDVARQAREGIATVTPDNLTDSLGRTLMVMGGALIALRALDALVAEDDAD